MRDIVVAYFAGEKRESVVFLALGVAAIVAAVMLWRSVSAFRGAMWPLLVVAIIQTFVGGTIFFRTDGQVAALEKQLDGDPEGFRRAEGGRMERVMASFRVYKMIEIALLVAAVVLLVVARPPAIAAGVGLGLLLQASVMLAADVVAEHRGAIYVAALRR